MSAKKRDRCRRGIGRAGLHHQAGRGRRRRRSLLDGAREAEPQRLRQGGINACNDIARQQGYSEWMHFDETVLGGDFLADQPPVLEMSNLRRTSSICWTAWVCPLTARRKGNAAFRLFGGSLFKRTFFAGATTGQQLLYALDEQTRRRESEGLVTKYEFWEFLWPMLNEGACVGIVAQDMRTMQIRAFRGDAVVMATGGMRAALRQNHDVGDLHRRRRLAVLSGRGEIRQSRIHPGPSHRHPRRGQMPADQRIGPRRRRPGLGAPKAPAIRRPQQPFPKPNDFTFSKSVIPNTAISSPATSPRGKSSRSAPK